MKFTLKRLIFIIILTSITKISIGHEFWIDPKNYHLSNNEKACLLYTSPSPRDTA